MLIGGCPHGARRCGRHDSVYSDDRNSREQVWPALGRRPAADLPEIKYMECATAPAVVKALELHATGDALIDLLILDGEAAPTGGMGLCRQLKDESAAALRCSC